MNEATTWRRYFLSVLLAAAIAPAAGALTLTGTIDAADPDMPVVFISTPNCTGQGVSLVSFEARPIFVTASGTYTFSQTSAGASPGFASLYLMSVNFDPDNGFPTCIAGSNGADPLGFAVPLVAGTQYYAVPFDDTFGQLGGTYVLDITGDGEVHEGAPTILAIPTLSQWGLVGLAALLALTGLFGLRKLRRA